MNDGKWWDVSWNPVTGCTPVSEACEHCYAKAMHQRFSKEPFSTVTLHPERLDAPLHWRKPRRVFVNSMSDLFHPYVPDSFIRAIIGTMTLCGQHKFLVLTKRPERMPSFFERTTLGECQAEYLAAGGGLFAPKGGSLIRNHRAINGAGGNKWPLPNLELGVTAETQECFNDRIGLLKMTPATLRFVSYEPLLGPIRGDLRGLDWIIVGPETGPRRRVCDPGWIRSIIDQCQAASVPCFVKAFPVGDCESCETDGSKCCCPRGCYVSHEVDQWPAWARVRQLPKITA